MKQWDGASRIDRVTVYRTGALITRRAKVTLERGGRSEVRFTGLPLALDDHSLRARLLAESPSDWRAVDVRAALDLTTSTQLDEVARLGLVTARREIEWLKRLRGTVASTELRGRTGEGELPVDARLEFLAFQSDVLGTLDRDLGEIESSVRKQELSGDHEGRGGKMVIVEIEQGSQDIDALVELDYFVPGPCWTPGYVARLTDRLDRCALIMQALVAQNTGEDWVGVDLTLTTAPTPIRRDPVSQSPRKPGERAAWRLPSKHPDQLFADFDSAFSTASGAQEDQPLRPSVPPLAYTADGQDRPSKLRPKSAYLDYTGLTLAAPLEAGRGVLRPAPAPDSSEHELVANAIGTSEAVATLPLPERYRRPKSHGGRCFTYRAESSAEVPSSETFVPCIVFERQITGTPRYVAVPRESEDVYRSTEIVNEDDAPLFEGPIDLYVGGNYVMTTDLPHIEPGGRTRLELGTEPGIEVTRRIQFNESRGRLLGGPRALKHGIRIEVSNHLDRRATVEVRERIPVPQRDSNDIKVSIDRVSPPWGRFAPERPELPGRYRWREHIDSEERVLLAVDYTVKLPVRLWLLGGDRREFS